MSQSLQISKYVDVLLLFILAALAAQLSWIYSAWVWPFVVWQEFDNLYFHADVALVFSNMTDFESNHYRTGMHPGFSLFSAFLVQAIRDILGFDSFRAVHTLLAANAAVQTALLYLLLRRIPLDKLTATGFTLIFLSSSAFIFWHSVPETFAFGGTTLLIMLLIASLPAPGKVLLITGNVVSMSMTMTNWMVAFYGTVWHKWGKWKNILSIFVVSGVIILAIGAFSKIIFTSSGYVGDFRRYLAWVRWPQPGDLPAFFGHSIVMPDPVFGFGFIGASTVSVEASSAGSGTFFAPLVLLIWIVLVLAGILGIWKQRMKAVSAVLGLTALSQLILHSFFSDGPFLFAAHFAPLLVLVAAHSAVLRRSKLILWAILALCIPMLAYNNLVVHEEIVTRLSTEMLPLLEVNGSPI